MYADTIPVTSHTVFIADIAFFCHSVGFPVSDFNSIKTIRFLKIIVISGIQGLIPSRAILALTAIDF